jgi:hypothetical protein
MEKDGKGWKRMVCIGKEMVKEGIREVKLRLFV